MKGSTKYLLFYTAFLFFIALGHGSDSFFNDKEELQLPPSYNIAWMAAIQDFRPLTLITIPGTHDSAARYGGWEAECQAWSLKDQLRAGIRFLDFRVLALGDTLYVMHGVMSQHTSLKEALDIVRSFLSEFRSETVLIRVTPEFFDKDTVNQMVQNLIANDKHVWVSSGMPSLGQVRGKIVFVQKNTFKLGIPLTVTGTKQDSKVSDINHKDNEIVKQLTQANIACGGDNAALTYASGTGFGTFWGMFLTPKRVAEKVNPWLNKYLKQFYPNHPRPCFAIIAMDYPGIDLIQTIIGLNSW